MTSGFETGWVLAALERLRPRRRRLKKRFSFGQTMFRVDVMLLVFRMTSGKGCDGCIGRRVEETVMGVSEDELKRL